MPRRAKPHPKRRGEASGQAANESLRGEGTVTVGLRALDSTDIGALRAWRNDWRIWRWCRQSDFISDVEQIDWFQRQAKDPQVRMYAVTANDNLVGAAGLTSIDWPNRRAEFSLYVAPDLQGRGVGRQALRCPLLHGFENLGLNVIWGETFDGNPAIKLFESLGMVREGTRRQFYFKEGRMIDAHLYSLKRDEWFTSQLQPLASPA